MGCAGVGGSLLDRNRLPLSLRYDLEGVSQKKNVHVKYLVCIDNYEPEWKKRDF